MSQAAGGWTRLARALWRRRADANQPALPFDAAVTQHPAPGSQDPVSSTQHPFSQAAPVPAWQALAPSTQHPPSQAAPAPAWQAQAPGIKHPDVVCVRHPRARRYVIRVAEDGTVRVTVPRWGSKREAKEFAVQQRAWIEKQWERVAKERARPRPVPLAPDRERELRAIAAQVLPSRLRELAALHGLTVTRVSIRNQRWRWGSCSRRGAICLNWRLAQMPDPVRDYVLIHELMHLKRMDHSPAFWKLVEAACPGHEAARAWLRTHAKRT